MQDYISVFRQKVTVPIPGGRLVIIPAAAPSESIRRNFSFLKGVSLKRNSVVELPAPQSEKSSTEYNYIIDLRHNDSIPHTVDYY